MNEISETVKELSPQLDDSAISEESNCDAVGDKSQGKVHLSVFLILSPNEWNVSCFWLQVCSLLDNLMIP